MIYRALRKAAALIVLVGVAVAGWGLNGVVAEFSTDFALLSDPTRTGYNASTALSEAAAMFNRAVFGAVTGQPVVGAARMVPQQGAPDGGHGSMPVTGGNPNADSSHADTQGFVPMAVEPVAEQHAPTLPPHSEQPALAPTETPPAADTPLPPAPTATPLPPAPPERIVISRIALDAPVYIVPIERFEVRGQLYEQWSALEFYAAGWHEGSAYAGEPGNTVLNGHHNIHGSVFGRLSELEYGDEITVHGGGNEYHYIVSQVMIMEERDVPAAERLENARWILPSDDERLTLVTCWPPDSNTHRLIVVAAPK